MHSIVRWLRKVFRFKKTTRKLLLIPTPEYLQELKIWSTQHLELIRKQFQLSEAGYKLFARIYEQTSSSEGNTQEFRILEDDPAFNITSDDQAIILEQFYARRWQVKIVLTGVTDGPDWLWVTAQRLMPK